MPESEKAAKKRLTVNQRVTINPFEGIPGCLPPPFLQRYREAIAGERNSLSTNPPDFAHPYNRSAPAKAKMAPLKTYLEKCYGNRKSSTRQRPD
ncbi:hypothetical protein [Pseudomonas fluorescens]|uniref:hypothetical protein n=1 Tax=Pseudomonas fluorescens TaxID=294 RepID=UPI0012D735C2|nr:hypothetical protein [Pseudomonas fluorescens]